MDYQKVIILFTLAVGLASAQECDPNLISEVRSYQPVAELILQEATTGRFKGVCYEKLANFVDRFQRRILGSQTLEDSIDYLLSEFQSDNSPIDAAWKEEVPDLPHWVRGAESVTLLEPVEKKLSILALGTSVGTPLPDGITAEAVVVKTFDELRALGPEKVTGKIVVYNQGFFGYGATGPYRNGASEASRQGAVAALIESLTPFSINSPHTGMQRYDADVTPIPAISITREDAEMLRRMYLRGDRILINLKSEAQNLPPAPSNNLIADYLGTTYPEKTVMMSGHIDNWDVGQGAMDDAGGFMVGLVATELIHALGLPRPKRTIRNVFWTAEEFGVLGAEYYLEQHKAELENFIFVMESDEGTFTPEGIYYFGDRANGECVIKEILNMFTSINATQFEWSPIISSDVSVFSDAGVPGASVINKKDTYFYYHHSGGDTMSVENSDDLDKTVAMYATMAYIIADLTNDFPRP